MEALQRGDIDLYPEYTGTALLAILKLPRPKTARDTYDLVRSEYERRYGLTWLDPAPMNDTQALATTRTLAQRYRISTLSQLSVAAPQLRLGSIPEFLKRDDGLPGLRRAYGGFNFKSIKLFDIGLKYEALTTGNVDVVVAFGTDGQIVADQLLVFTDDKHVWPTYNVAPVVRQTVLAAHPQIAFSLDRLSPMLTDDVMRALNDQVDGQKQDPADVASAFLKRHGLG
jgi:osmoprotectant transport system substrate-binding protein